jgi:hypothetical protein
MKAASVSLVFKFSLEVDYLGGANIVQKFLRRNTHLAGGRRVDEGTNAREGFYFWWFLIAPSIELP